MGEPRWVSLPPGGSEWISLWANPQAPQQATFWLSLLISKCLRPTASITWESLSADSSPKRRTTPLTKATFEEIIFIDHGQHTLLSTLFTCMYINVPLVKSRASETRALDPFYCGFSKSSLGFTELSLVLGRQGI